MPIPWLTVIFTWLLFLPIPVINGYLRETWYEPIVGTLIAHQIGVSVLSIAFLVYAFKALTPHVAHLSTTQLFLIGLTWLALTLAFEFGVGIVEGRSLSYMLEDYKVWEGRIWPIVLVVVATSPFIVRFFQARPQLLA
jgi:ABC-type antimicrobial peptide transport system permease subunit